MAQVNRSRRYLEKTRFMQASGPARAFFRMRILLEYVRDYNRGRSSLGPGIPEPTQVRVPEAVHRHKLPTGFGIKSTPVLSGLHHEYSVEKRAA